MDSAQAGQIWKSLRKAIDEIHNKNASVLSFEELYRNAYNLVLHKHGELLYDGVKEAVHEHLETVAAVVAATPDEQLLAVTSTCWSDHQVTMVMVRDILMYMDRTYVAQNKKTAVYDVGLQARAQAAPRLARAAPAAPLAPHAPYSPPRPPTLE